MLFKTIAGKRVCMILYFASIERGTAQYITLYNDTDLPQKGLSNDKK